MSIFIWLIEEGRRLYLHQPRESGKQGLDQKRFANIFHWIIILSQCKNFAAYLLNLSLHISCLKVNLFSVT